MTEHGQPSDKTDNKIVVAIVDDDVAFSRNLRRLLTLESDNLNLSVHNDPNELLKLLDDQHIDVIISDIFMPQMTGLEFIQQVRRINLDIPVILLTATPSDSTTRRAIELGAQAYLVKPPSIKTLMSQVNQAAFNHNLARLKRSVFEAAGTPDHRPGDLAGLQDAFTDALEQLRLVFQPIVCAKSGKVFGYEALIRSEYVRLPSATAVVEAAEELGLMGQLSEKVLDLATSFDLPEGARLFLNILPEDLTQLPERFSSGMPAKLAKRTVLELSERQRLERFSNIDDALTTLRGLGLEFAIDDFGTGLAGVVNFAALKPEFVKVDHSLIHELSYSVSSKNMIQSLLGLCKAQGVKTIAEGVENNDTFFACKDIGFDYVQGFHIDHPSFANENQT